MSAGFDADEPASLISAERETLLGDCSRNLTCHPVVCYFSARTSLPESISKAKRVMNLFLTSMENTGPNENVLEFSSIIQDTNYEWELFLVNVSSSEFPSAS